MPTNTIYTERTMSIPRDMVKSKAYRSLSTGAAHIVLMTFMTLRQMKEIKDPKRKSSWEVINDNTLVYTYEQAERQGLSVDRFCAAIDLLLDRGFIRIVKTGRGKYKNASIYGLSDAWKNWKPDDPPKVIRKKRKAEGGIGFQVGNMEWAKRNSSTGKNTRSLVDGPNTSGKNTRNPQR